MKEYRNTDWRQQQLDLADQAVQIRIFRLTTKARGFDRFHEGRTYTLPCNVCDLAPRSEAARYVFMYIKTLAGECPGTPFRWTGLTARCQFV